MDYFTDVIEDINGGFTVFGSIYPEDGNSHDFWLVCFNENGDTTWTRTFGSDLQEIPKKLVQNADESYLLKGSVKKENSDNLFLRNWIIKGMNFGENVLKVTLFIQGKMWFLLKKKVLY